jgi:outer membrane protein TolC
MAFWDVLTSTKRPASDTAVCSPGEVRERIMAVNRPTAPFRIVEGQDEGVDFIAEWKIVDARWYEIFAKAGLEKVFRIHLKLDEAEHEVRSKDHEYSLAWSAGVPRLELSASRTWGQVQSVQFGTAYAFTEELQPGQVYNYRFSTRELKEPIQEAVTGCGWTYRGISFGKL